MLFLVQNKILVYIILMHKNNFVLFVLFCFCFYASMKQQVANPVWGS